MNPDTLIAHLLAGEPVPSAPLPDEVAGVVVERLKQEADQNWWKDANRSLALANQIADIGRARGDLRQMALGLMARGDALKVLGSLDEAWAILGRAGDLFNQAGDAVGWARTRIGRLIISVDLNRVDEALADERRSRDILTQHDEPEILLRLDINTAIVHDMLGDHRQALTLYHDALDLCATLGEAGQRYLGILYTNIGYAYNFLGDFRQGLAYYERAHAILTARQETGGAAVAELNIAYIVQAQGQYRRALQILHRVQDTLAGQFPSKHAAARRTMVECYLFLNRFLEARELAQQVVAEFSALGADYETACTLRHLATAEAELANYAAAHAALDRAESIFQSLGAATWLGTIHLRKGRIALLQGDTDTAQREARAAMTCFESGSQRVNYATAVLLDGQTRLADHDPEAAAHAGRIVLAIAQRSNAPALRYSAHVLLGHSAETRPARAMRHYRAAIATVERVQRGLTITLRPGFLEDKSEALRRLIRLHMDQNQIAGAFETLERAKSQVMLGYLAHREGLHWAASTPQAHALIEELEHLRAEHHWLYQRVNEPSDQTAVDPDRARQQLATCERRMRAITEQLYLQENGSSPAGRVKVPALGAIQDRLPDGTLLIEFYNDGSRLWAFTLDRASIALHPLAVTVSELDTLIDQFRFNIACALKVGPSPAARQLATLMQRIAQRLHAALIAPLADRLRDRPRLVIVPFGRLHYLPFHLLHDGTHLLIEQAEVVILPTAGLQTQPGPRRAGGARILAHSWEGRLPETLAEARMVQQVFGGDVYGEQGATRAALEQPPCQILHIAAHGEHRIDQPDLSYIHLGDGQLYTDDLLQQDMSYELVTLSACETGRANVAAGDELIGLGRGFLYAGAGALVASLWRVHDAATVSLMTDFYRALAAGASKAAALRQAQCTARNPDLHPAFWGAFQLVGDPSPLATKEHNRVTL